MATARPSSSFCVCKGARKWVSLPPVHPAAEEGKPRRNVTPARARAAARTRARARTVGASARRTCPADPAKAPGESGRTRDPADQFRPRAVMLLVPAASGRRGEGARARPNPRPGTFDDAPSKQQPEVGEHGIRIRRRVATKIR
jgi:hypothetical protein